MILYRNQDQNRSGKQFEDAKSRTTQIPVALHSQI